MNKHAQALGRIGGKAKSKAKTKSCRANGKLGGRPRKDTTIAYATCIREPRGDHGLEGYILGNSYKVQKMTKYQIMWYRIWPDPESPYFETCGPDIFKKHFKPHTDAYAELRSILW